MRRKGKVAPLQEISAYEQQRQNNIKENNAKLAALNLSPLVKKTKATPAAQNRKRHAAEKKLVQGALPRSCAELWRSCGGISFSRH